MQKRSQEEYESTSGFATAPYYDSQVLQQAGLHEDEDYPPPGRYPFTRGFSPEGFRDEFWAWEMYAGFGERGRREPRYRFLLENGAPAACRSPSTCRRRSATTATT